MRSDCSDPPSLLLSTSSSSSESFPPTAVNTEGCEVTAHSVTQKLPLCGVRGVMWPVYYEMRLFFALAFSNLWDKFVIDLWAFALMSWHLVVSHDPHWVPVLKTHLQDYSADRQLTFVLKILWKTVWDLKKKSQKIKLITTTYAPAKQIKTGVFWCMLVPVMSHTLAWHPLSSWWRLPSSLSPSCLDFLPSTHQWGSFQDLNSTRGKTLTCSDGW